MRSILQLARAARGMALRGRSDAWGASLGRGGSRGPVQRPAAALLQQNSSAGNGELCCHGAMLWWSLSLFKRIARFASGGERIRPWRQGGPVTAQKCDCAYTRLWMQHLLPTARGRRAEHRLPTHYYEVCLRVARPGHLFKGMATYLRACSCVLRH